MKSIEEIKKNIIKIELEISKYKELTSNKPTNWRQGKDINDIELVEERNAFFKVSNIIDKAINSNNIIISQLNDSPEDNEKLNLVKNHNHNLINFIMNFFK